MIMSRSRLAASLAAATVLAATAGPAAAQVFIDTTVVGTAVRQPFGTFGEYINELDDDGDGQIDNNAPIERLHTYGQTFVAPAGCDRLESTRFFVFDRLRSFGSGLDRTLTFRARVMAWDDANSRATGSELYVSDPVSAAQNNTLQTFDFLTVNLPLAPGQTYVAFLTQEGFEPAGAGGNNTFAAFDIRTLLGGGTYAGGTLVSKFDGTLSLAGLTSEPWAVSPDDDAAVRLGFAPVPEPSPLLLAGLSSAGLCWRRGRRAIGSESPLAPCGRASCASQRSSS